MYNIEDNSITVAATLNSTLFNKSVAEIESKIKSLSETKASLQIELAENSSDNLDAQVEAQISSIDKRLAELSLEKTLTIDSSLEHESITSSLEEANSVIELSLDNMQNTIDNSISFDSFASELQSYSTTIKSTFSSIASYASSLGDAIVNFLNVGIDNQLIELEQNYNTELDLLKSNYEEKNLLYDEHLEYLTEGKKEYNENISKLTDELNVLEAKKQTLMTEEDYLALQEQIENKEAQIEEQINIYEELEKDHAQTLANQEQAEVDYAEAKTEIEQNYQIEKATMERKAAENSKAVAIFNATISMLQGIMQGTLAGLQAGFPLALGFVPVFTALAATTGALQIAAISSQPLPDIPTFATGGYVDSQYANNYQALGLSSPNAVDNTLAWLSTGERILTPEQNSIYEKMLSANYTTHNSKSEIANTYNVSVNVAKTNASSKAIAKEVVKAIGGKV